MFEVVGQCSHGWGRANYAEIALGRARCKVVGCLGVLNKIPSKFQVKAKYISSSYAHYKSFN